MKILIAFLITLNTLAVCETSQYSVEINLDNKTFDLAFMDGQANFEASDFVIFNDKKNQRTYQFKKGLFEDDGAGNFYVVAENNDGESIEIYHDHEVWHEGLTSSYVKLKNDLISFEEMRDCSFDLLFNISN